MIKEKRNKKKYQKQKLTSTINSILIITGKGVSTMACLEYSGERWEKNCLKYLKKYKIKDWYTSGFYNF